MPEIQKALYDIQGNKINQETSATAVLLADGSNAEEAIASKADKTHTARLQDSITDITETMKTVIPDVSVSTYARMTSLSANAREGQMNVKVSGNTLKNEVVNGNFANGTSGWNNTLHSTVSATNNTLSITANGTISSGRAGYLLGKGVTGKKYYIKISARVTNAVASKMLLTLKYPGVGAYSILDFEAAVPTQNIWYSIAGIATIGSGADSQSLYITVMHAYADAATANGKVMEVKDVICIDMGTDASNPLYNKTKEEMDLIAGQNYFDGLASVVAGSVKTVGKNLVESAYTPKETNPYMRNLFIKAPLKPNTVYKLSFVGVSGNSYYVSEEIAGMVTVNCTGGRDFVTVTTNSSLPSYGTSSFNANGYGILKNNKAQTVNTFTEVMLEEGTTATPYEPYTETVRTLPASTLRSLPNGVKDYVDGNRLVQNTKEYVLQASDITSLQTFPTNLDYVGISKALDYVGYNKDVQIKGNAVYSIANRDIQYSDAIASQYNIFQASVGTFGYGVPKGTYANLAAAQAALAGTKIIYQLATPVVTELLPDTLKSSPKGSIIYQNTRDEVDFYGANMPVSNTAVPIKALSSVVKINIEDGSETPIALTTCTVASGGLSFTSTALASGDLVEFEYEFDSALSTTPLLEYGYKNEKGDFPATNLITNGDFSNGTTGWNNTGLASFTASSNEAIGLADGAWDYFSRSVYGGTTIGNKYYVSAMVKSTSKLIGHGFDTLPYVYHSGSGNYEIVSNVQTATKSNHFWLITDIRASGFDNFYVKYIKVINLTATFGAGNEPTVAEMDAIMSLYPNSWFAGTVNPLLTPKQMLELIRAKANIVQENWITPTLTNGWVNFDTNNYYGCSYMKDTLGFVHIRGLIKSGAVGTATPVFTLPSGYRPTRTQTFAINSNTAFGTAQVAANGNLSIASGNNAFAYLDTITFKAEA